MIIIMPNIRSILMTEAYTSLAGTLKYYGKVENGVITKYAAEIPFIFEMQVVTEQMSSAYEFKEVIDECIKKLPTGDKIHPNWIVSEFLL